LLLGRVATASLSGLETLLESSVRSYLVGNAGSRPISEAKQPWACLVLRWGTTGEAHVLYSLPKLLPSQRLRRAVVLLPWLHQALICVNCKFVHAQISNWSKCMRRAVVLLPCALSAPPLSPSSAAIWASHFPHPVVLLTRWALPAPSPSLLLY